jgi:hypothetical protein
VPSEKCSIEEQSIEYCGRVVSSGVVGARPQRLSQPQGHSAAGRIIVTPSGIEPATF